MLQSHLISAPQSVLTNMGSESEYQSDDQTRPELDQENLSTPKKSKKKHKRKREKVENEAEEAEENVEKVEEKVEIVHATIQCIQSQPDKIPPLVGYFPSGFDPHKSRNQGRDEDSGHEPDQPLKVKVYRNKRMTNRLQLVVSPSGSNVNFVGSSYSGEATAGQGCTYSLGVLDKEKGTLKITPIAGNKIFRLEPRVGGSEYADKEASDLEKGSLSVEQKAAAVRNLTNQFGTKRSINADRRRHQLKQEDDPKSQKDLDRKIKELKVNKEALESTDAQTALNIPPYNLAATTPQEAYPLEKIILSGEWDFLGDIFQLFLAGAEVPNTAYPTFVCNRLQKLQEIQDEQEQRTLSCIFSYITHLVKFKDQHSMDGYSSAKNHRIPNIVYKRFSTMFTDQESKKMPKDKISLLINYVLVLTMYVDGFRTNPVDIAKDLRMSPVDLRKNFEYLGCKFVQENRSSIATLPVPLQHKFQKLRAKRAR